MGFVVTLIAARVVSNARIPNFRINGLSKFMCQSGATEVPSAFSFGFQRAALLGAFFNGSFLLAIGVSTSSSPIRILQCLEKLQLTLLIQTVERFVQLEREFTNLPWFSYIW